MSRKERKKTTPTNRKKTQNKQTNKMRVHHDQLEVHPSGIIAEVYFC